jgi:hypothetical protein
MCLLVGAAEVIAKGCFAGMAFAVEAKERFNGESYEHDDRSEGGIAD